MKAPAIGIIDIRNMTTPHSSGDGRPSRKKIAKPSRPWIAEMASQRTAGCSAGRSRRWPTPPWR